MAVLGNFLATILDAAERSRSRRNLRVYGREVNGDEDHLLPQADLDTVRQRCQDYRRNNPIVSGAIDRIVDNVIGSRIIMQARTSDTDWNDTAEHWLDNWSSATDPAMRTSLTQAARFTVSSRMYNGEIFHQPTPDGQVAIIEADRVRDPQDGKSKGAVPGARIDAATGKITGWCIHTRDVYGGFSMKHAEKWVPGLIHCSRRHRPDQVRSYPDLAVVANIVADLGAINTANLKKMNMGAMAAWVYEKGQAGGHLAGRTVGTNPASPSAQPLHKFKDGQIYEIDNGGKLTSFRNNDPGGEYAPFVELNLRLVGMALGLPYEFLLLYFGGGSFSTSKASMLQVYKTIETWQAWVEDEYLCKVIPWRIAKAIRDREIPPAPIDKNGVSEWHKWEWQKPSVDWLDPQNAVQTEMQEVRMGSSSMFRVCARHGADAEVIARENARYLKMLARVGKEEGVDPAALHAIQIPGQSAPVPATPEGAQHPDADKKEGPE